MRGRTELLPERPLEPPKERPPFCPVCGEECDEYVYGIVKDGAALDIIGCDRCTERRDAWDESGAFERAFAPLMGGGFR